MFYLCKWGQLQVLIGMGLILMALLLITIEIRASKKENCFTSLKTL